MGVVNLKLLCWLLQRSRSVVAEKMSLYVWLGVAIESLPGLVQAVTPMIG